MKLTLLTVGKTAFSYLNEGISVYSKRIEHYVNFNIVEIPELKGAASLSMEQIKEKEGELIFKKIKEGDYVTLLDERGKKFGSENWAHHLERRIVYSNKDIVFVIGGAYGFSQKIYDRADEMLSLSEMTFSHQIIRVIFMEQLYRAFTIIKGEPYHHK
jgi:23S rRNA (pseudouridine1915-N3)-methyltransferase